MSKTSERLQKVEDLENKLCKSSVPSGMNIYKWAKKNPDTSIAHALGRIEKIFDKADEVVFGFSSGKDSTLSAELAILELKRRRSRVDAGINRNGENKIDPLDEKWKNKKLWGNHMHSEWVWTDAIKHTNDFVKRHGPKGGDVINFFYKCLRLGWQSGVTFGDSRLISWDPKQEDMWIVPMPDEKDLGIDIITHDSILTANPVPLDSLSPEMQEMRKAEGSIIEVDGVKMVPNYGLGNRPLSIKGYENIPFRAWYFENMAEDYEQETFGTWMLKQFPKGTQIYNLVSLRASESFDRYTILKQSDYSTGEYASQKL